MGDFSYFSGSLDECVACGATELESEWAKYMTADEEELVYVCAACGHTHRRSDTTRDEEEDEEMSCRV